METLGLGYNRTRAGESGGEKKFLVHCECKHEAITENYFVVFLPSFHSICGLSRRFATPCSAFNGLIERLLAAIIDFVIRRSSESSRNSEMMEKVFRSAIVLTSLIYHIFHPSPSATSLHTVLTPQQLFTSSHSPWIYILLTF